MRSVIVVGGGPAGVSAALRARELGASVTLVERARLGGTCTNRGCVPARVWAKVARLMRDAAQLQEYGLSGSAPTLDFSALQRRVQSVIAELHDKKRLRDHLAENEITVREGVGDAAFRDAHTLVLENGEELRGDAFILCAGGHPRKPPFPGSELALTPIDLWDLPTLPRSVAIVGASATGCQLASVLATFGATVTLLEAAPRILPTEDASVSEAIAEAFRTRGITVHTDLPQIERIARDGDRLRLHYPADSSAPALDAETIVLSVGWPGNGESLKLEAAGVETDGDFIRVDDSLRSSVAHIYAAGDITGRMLLVPSAMHEGRRAAENLLQNHSENCPHENVPRGGFTDPEYAGVGETEEQANKTGDCLSVQVPYSDLDRAVIDGRPEGFCKLIVSRSTGDIRGAHVVGEQALEVVQAVAAGMGAGIGVDQFAAVEFAYPTFTAILGLAARHACKERGSGPYTAVRDNLTHPRAGEWEHRAAPEIEN